MHNTYIPLDMIFIRADGRILRIAENTEPMSDRLIPSGGPVRAVLEVIAGTARKFGIAPGDRVESPIFAGGTRPEPAGTWRVRRPAAQASRLAAGRGNMYPTARRAGYSAAW